MTTEMSKPTKRFVVKYRGAEDKQGPVFDWRCYAFDAEHAEMKFWDSGAAEEGWGIVSIDRPRTPHGTDEPVVDDGAPWCSYGHRTKEQCDCGPIAENE